MNILVKQICLLICLLPVIAFCQLHYEVPYLCRLLKVCPCEHLNKGDVIVVKGCPGSRQEDSALFTSEVVSNATLIYEDQFISSIEGGSFRGMKMARIEICNAKNVRDVGNNIFYGARVDSIRIDLDNPVKSNKVVFKSRALAGWTKKLNPGSHCRILRQHRTLWYENFSKHCRALELSRWTPLGNHTLLKSDLFYDLSNLKRLVIEGNFHFTDDNPFSSLSDSLEHLQLGGYILANLSGQTLGSLEKLKTIRLRQHYSRLNISTSNIRQWLARKPNLQRIALEDGLDISHDIFDLIDNPEAIIEISFRGAHLTELPDRMPQFLSLKRLDIANTDIIIPSKGAFWNFENLTFISITENITMDDCNCSSIRWLYHWTPYVDHGMELFSINHDRNTSGEAKNDMLECISHCGATGLFEFKKIIYGMVTLFTLYFMFFNVF